METPVTARAALLQVLLEGPGYGLELAERVKERTGGKIVIRQGSLYPALSKFEAEGLVRLMTDESLPSGGGHPRTYYRLTQKGEQEALGLREILVNLVKARSRKRKEAVVS